MAGTRISYLSGIGADQTPLTIQSGNAIAKQPYIEYLGMSEAKLLVTLGKRSQEIRLSTIPNHPDAAAWQRNIQRANDFLSGKGGAVTMAGTDTAVDRQFIQFLDYAQDKTHASFMHGMHGDPLSMEDCGRSTGTWDYDDQNNWVYFPANPDFYNCSMRNAKKKGVQDALNEYLEKSGHHVLYNFIGNLNDTTNIVAQKGFLHQNYVQEIKTISGLSRDAVLLWIRNGIEDANARKGLGILNPEATIQKLMEGAGDDRFDIENPSQFPNIGIDPVTVGLIIALCVLLVKAQAVALSFILALKQKDATIFTATALNLLGTEKASPNAKTDFNIGTNNGGNGGIITPCQTGYTRNAAGTCVPIVLPSTNTTLGLTKKQWTLVGAGGGLLLGGMLIFSGKKERQG